MSETPEERKRRDDQIRETIMTKLIESGEKDRLKEFLRQQLNECGWQDECKEYSRDVIRRKGTEKLSVEELVAEIIPFAKNKIPPEIKTDLLRQVREFLQSS